MERITKLYTGIAILVFNTLLMLMCINLAFLGYGFVDSDSIARPTPAVNQGVPLEVYHLGPLRVGFEDTRAAYTDYSDGELIWLLLETHNLERVCDDAAQFREKTYHGRYITIDENGFRHIAEQADFPPPEDAFNVFVFGGSTAFGFGERDENSLPSFLQQRLREAYPNQTINVYNFARVFYFSPQERALFVQLIEEGFKPDLAIFVDGLNDFILYDGNHPPNFQNCESEEIANRTRLRNTLTCQIDEFCLPLQAYVTNQRYGNAIPTPLPQVPDLDSPISEPPQSLEDIKLPEGVPPLDDLEIIDSVIDRWLEQKTTIESTASDVQTLFIMQPVPMYAYNLEYHNFYDSVYEFGANLRVGFGYARWEERYESEDWADNVLNLSHLAEEETGIVYIDVFHYSADFNDTLAQAIVAEIQTRSWVD